MGQIEHCAPEKNSNQAHLAEEFFILKCEKRLYSTSLLFPLVMLLVIYVLSCKESGVWDSASAFREAALRGHNSASEADAKYITLSYVLVLNSDTAGKI